MKFIIFDIEATCLPPEDKEINPNFESEIIQIGAVKVRPVYNNKELTLNKYNKVAPAYDHMHQAGIFNAYIKPDSTDKLTKYCTDLTGITDELLDEEGKPFEDVITEFQQWIFDDNESQDKDAWLCSWGFYDKAIMEEQCYQFGISKLWLQKHISIKHQYSRIIKQKYMSIKNAIKREGLKFEGRQHDAVNDSKAAAKIFEKHFEEFIFRVFKNEKEK